MTRLLYPALALTAAAALFAATPAEAQRAIRAGQTLEGRLDASDPTLGDGSHYEMWAFEGRRGERVSVTLRSSDFDAYLAFGDIQGDECDCETDDDGAGGTDARVTMTLPRDGTFHIRANTLAEGETGGYTLTVEDLGEAPQPTVRRVRVGQTVTGRLDASDAVAGDESFYELWTVRGAAGERLVITLRSGDFDAFLGWGTLGDGGWSEMESDDDGAGGDSTDSRLEVTLPESGEYAIRANTLSAGESGAYTLTVERAPR